MNKKGISAVVATVLVILITVASVSLVWFGVMPMISDFDLNVNPDLSLISNKGYTLWDNSSRLATVQVGRGSDESNIVGFDLVFSLEGTSVSHFIEDVPGINGEKVYYINLSGYSGDLDSVGIAPVFGDGSVGGIISRLTIGKIGEADVFELIEEGVIAEDDFVVPSGSGGRSGGGGGGGGDPCVARSICVGEECGSLDDGCGGFIDCGECVSCEDTCSSLGFVCGMWDVCGVSTYCGSCDSGESCSAGSCIADGWGLSESGWTVPVPSVYDISTYGFTDLEQPGSRIFYISNLTGDDNTASIYFWNGTHIVNESGSATGEGGVLFGTDPMNPSGPIMPFKRWAYVAPRWYTWMDIGLEWDGSYNCPGNAGAQTRKGYPDWWMFNRGETFDLHEDMLSFAQETNASLTSVRYGSLSSRGGRSETERQIIGAYGSEVDPRPRFINPPENRFINSRGEDIKNIAYLSLHFDGRGELRGEGFNFWYQNSSSVDVLLEDVWIDGTEGNSIESSSGEITFRRCLITDSFMDDGSRLQGLFIHPNRESRIRMEECIFMRNGFSNGDPAVTGWPPNGEQIYDIYNRNMYLHGETQNMDSGFFDSISLIGASGDQFRLGMRVERNFFYQGYVALGAYGGYSDSDGPTGSFLDNVFQRFKGSGTNDNRGQPGWSTSITSGASEIEFARNIVTNVQYENDYNAFSLSSLNWVCYAHIFKYPTRNNNIYNNIFDSSAAPSAISIFDGVSASNLDCSNWIFPGITNNYIYNNTLINQNGVEWEYLPTETAEGTSTDTAFSDNAVYLTRTEAALAEGWPDSERSLKTYLESIGVSVTSDDGYMEFFDEAIKQRRGYWREDFTARPLVNHFREGFGMELLG